MQERARENHGCLFIIAFFFFLGGIFAVFEDYNC